MYSIHLVLSIVSTTMLIPSSLMAATLQFVNERQELKTEMFIGTGCVKVIDHEAPDVYSIYDSTNKQFVSVDKRERQYYQLNEQAMKDMGQQIKSAQQQMMVQMQEQMKDMTPEQRQQMEQMMGQMGMPTTSPSQRPKVRIEATAQYRKVNGIRCKIINVYRGDTKEREVCVANREALGLSKADYDTLVDMGEFMKRLASTNPFVDEAGFTGIMGTNGVAVQVKELDDNNVVTYAKGSGKHLSSSVCQIPADYQHVDPMRTPR